MKETNIELIQQTITQVHEEEEWTIKEFMNEEAIKQMSLQIYLTADVLHAGAYDARQYDNYNTSVIWTATSISIITGGHASRYGYKQQPYFKYDFLYNDIYSLYAIIETVFQRLLSSI